MAVTRPRAAREALRLLVGQEPVRVRQILADPYLPSRLTAGNDQPLRLGPDDLIGGYGDEARYRIGGPLAALIAGPAEDAMRTGHIHSYARASMDLTMRGGTTSGVVYPLATCDLATRFRFRNVGGASAGALAAALAAAAELGRSEPMRGRVLVATSVAKAPIPAPVLRRGFPGLADVMAWLTQVAPGESGPDEFRLAQLFRPGTPARDVFRVLVAALRGRHWPLPVLALTAFGRPVVAVTIGILVLSVLGASWLGQALAQTTTPWYASLAWGALSITGFVLAVVALVLIGQLLLSAVAGHRRRHEERRRAGTPLGLLGKVTSGTPVNLDGSSLLTALVAALLLAGAAALAVTAPLHYLAAWIVGLAGSFMVLVLLLAAVWRYIARFKREAFGLIGGSEQSRPLTWLDRLAHLPEPTVLPALVPWLSNALSQLAGLPTGEVLRFGHLWDGAGYRSPDGERSREDVARWEHQERVTDARLVNLELMTTDLARGRPYRFPLRLDELAREPLYLRLDQLTAAQMFPPEVMTALGETDSLSAVLEGEKEPVTLHRFPAPWDLPVIVAARISMALPGLFKAVPFYRLRGGELVRDDFGRPVLLDGVPLTRASAEVPLPPAGGPPPAPPVPVAEELWFSDGGITSNFPVHFFDAVLPRWPTVSLNLGGYPDHEPMQDVWLPRDWEPVSIPAEPLGRSALTLASAVLDTAMGWRDSMQSALPGYRSRIAQVRTRSDEGAVNLYMSRDTIASLGLRGALAGARLRTRFGDDREWDRFRWLRLRVALSNLERLRLDTDGRRRFYGDILSRPDWLTEAEKRYLDSFPAPPGLTWYPPPPGFWPQAQQFLDAFADAHHPTGPNPLLVNAPTPEPVLRLVPQE